MTKKKRLDTLLLILLGILLFGGGLLLVFFPAPAFSPLENRQLAERPRLSIDALRTGEYAAALDSYTAQRLPGRSSMRALYGICELSLGKGEVGGVLLCRDGSLARRQPVRDSALKQNTAGLKKVLATTKIPCTVAMVPTRAEARGAVLPRLYPKSKAVCCATALALPDALLLDSITGDECWFKTDHHWTAAGAYLAYAALGAQLGYTPYPAEAFTRETVTDSFYGTSYGAAALPFIAADRIELWRYAGDTALRLSTQGTPLALCGPYDFAKLQTRDGYAVFQGGNHGVLEITLGETDTRPTLLVIRDSFAAALLPFLARHYRIVALDPRYAPAGSYTAALQEAEQVLFLCGAQTVMDSPFWSKL